MEVLDRGDELVEEAHRLARQRRDLAVRPRVSPSGDFPSGARERGAVVVDDLRVERRDAKERRQLVLRKPVQDDDVDRVDVKDRVARGDTRNVEGTRATA